jgi:hypothetical protein
MITADASSPPDKPWTGIRLLVPMKVEALVVTSNTSGTWACAGDDFGNLSQFVPAEPSPVTASSINPPDNAGVYVHWAVPAGFLRGSSSGPGQPVVFPPVPNRWLVIRSQPDDPSAPPVAWVVESDYFSTANGGTNSFPNPANPAQIGSLGRRVSLAGWPSSVAGWPDGNETSTVSLSAVGAVGDPSYPAFVWNNGDVFSFLDPAIDVVVGSPPAVSNLTYTVVGWFSDPSLDPLYAIADLATWQQRIATLGWSVGVTAQDDSALLDAQQAADAWLAAHRLDTPSEATSLFPQQTLCHGMVFQVPWTGEFGAVQSAVPTGQDPIPQVAIGNTAIDALSAWIQYQIDIDPSPPAPGSSPVTGAQVAEIMRAFQYNLLDQPESEIDWASRQAWFGATDGGSLWVVQRPPSPLGEPSPPTAASASPPSGQAPWLGLLDQLNVAQSKLDATTRALTRRQTELYELWWKLGYFKTLSPTQQNEIESSLPLPPDVGAAQYLNDCLATLAQQVTAMIVAIDAQTDARDALQAQLSEMLGDSMQVVEAPAPPFHQPNEPVVLIYGGNRSAKYGANAFSPAGLLFCRFSGQTLTGISPDPSAPSPVVLGLFDLGLSLPPIAPGQPLPLEIPDLLLESYLLDIENAGAIAAIAVERGAQTTAPAVQKQQTLMWNTVANPELDVQTIADATGLVGASGLPGGSGPPVPYPCLISAMPWSPPWSPLYLDWSVAWYPTWASTNTLPGGWTFDGVDFSWSDGAQLPWAASPPVEPTTILGRTVLTPQPATSLLARLTAFLAQPNLPSDLQPAIQSLKAFLQQVGDWDLLAQTLSGFNAQLVLRDPQTRLAAPTSVTVNGNTYPLSYLIAYDPTGASQGPAPAPNPGPAGATGPSPFFSPLRAGFLRIASLFLVDDFGQVFSPIEAIGGGTCQPLMGAGLAVSTPFDQPAGPLSTGGNPLYPSPTFAQLPPRLMQGARLSFALVSNVDDAQPIYGVDSGADPVCGWLLPNFLDPGLLVFDPGGHALGELIVMGIGGNPRVVWQPFPGSLSPVGAPPAIANPHLLAFVQGLLNRPDGGAAALEDLIQVIDASLWTFTPEGGAANQNLTLLIGQPLALVRASLRIELDGGPIADPSWSNTGAGLLSPPGHAPSPPFTQVPLPVRLGSLQLTDDSLIGWFSGDDYRTFNTMLSPAGGGVESPPGPAYTASSDNDLALESGGPAAYVTLLLDPRGVVHANAGVLPTTTMSVPEAFVTSAIATMEVTFRVGPLLGDPLVVAAPLPSGVTGTWTWMQRASVSSWTTSSVAKLSPTGTVPARPQTLRQGWLKLAGALDDDRSPPVGERGP